MERPAVPRIMNNIEGYYERATPFFLFQNTQALLTGTKTDIYGYPIDG